MKRSFHTYIRYIAALFLTLCLLPWGILAVHADEGPAAPLPVCYQQNDPRWGHLEQLAPGGCGILSLVNAVHFLTGNFIDPVGLAAYARSIDAYYGSVGGGTARWVLYHQLEDYEKKYGFEVTMTGKDAGAKHQSLIDHLASGGTAVAHVKGHFIALCGYDKDTDSMLVYDPAATPDRQTTVEPQWKTTDFLSSHPRMTVDWFCLIQRTGDTEVKLEGLGEIGQNRELFTSVRAGLESAEPTVLKGTVKHRSPLETLYYTLNYDRKTIYETAIDLGGKRSADFSLPLDVSGWKKGRHTLRLTARGVDGSVTDIAEYTVFVSDGTDGYDPATGTLSVNMSAYVDQSGIIHNSKPLDYEGYVWRSTADTMLYLGTFDLSRYTAVRFYYSVRGEFFGDTPAMVGLCSSPALLQGEGDPNAVAMGSLPPADIPLSEIQTVTVDLTDCTYSGELWISLLRPTRKVFYLREIRFYEGDIPADTEEITEPVTEMTTEPSTTAAEEHTSSDADTSAAGCASTLSVAILPAVFVAFALLSATDSPNRKRRSRRR